MESTITFLQYSCNEKQKIHLPKGEYITVAAMRNPSTKPTSKRDVKGMWNISDGRSQTIPPKIPTTPDSLKISEIIMKTQKLILIKQETDNFFNSTTINFFNLWFF